MSGNMTWLQAALIRERAWMALALTELAVIAFFVVVKVADVLGM